MRDRERREPRTMLVDRVIGRFPPTAFAMAYGSGVFKQAGYGAQQPMLDMVLAVDDPVEWHRANLEANTMDYAWMPRRAGPEFITHLQDNFGAGLYYNTLVPIQLDDGTEQMIKYGVMDVANLLSDLNEWSTLYVAGRMHKPVKVLTDAPAAGTDDHGVLAAAMESNRVSAVKAALLMLPRCFSETDLFLKIASISYLGDIRMGLAENPKKVQNIVSGQVEGFRSIYLPILSSHPQLNTAQVTVDSGGVAERSSSSSSSNGGTLQSTMWEQQVSTEHRAELLRGLPAALSTALASANAAGVGSQGDWADVLAGQGDDHVVLAMSATVKTIVSSSSKGQSAKGILTAGISKSLTYAGDKVKKMMVAA